jgi:hypothetical protein
MVTHLDGTRTYMQLGDCGPKGRACIVLRELLDMMKELKAFK